MALEDIGALLLRVILGVLFLSCVWGCSKDATARQNAVAATALVFKRRPELFATASVLLAAAGALSVLLGVFPRLGALAMVIYLVPAAMVHFAMQRESLVLQAKILRETNGKIDVTSTSDVSALGATAAFGHMTAGLKNLFLIAPAAYLVLAGGRPPMLIGFGPDWKLQGLLTQL